MKVHRVSRYWIAATLAVAPVAAQAQGFGLNELGSCAVARGYANTGAPCRDASAIYWNPAATTTLDGSSLLVGAASIAITGSFTQDTTGRKYDGDVPTAIVPHLFYNYHAPASRWAWGVGAYVPYGLTSQWHDDFIGRFSAKKASLQTIYVQPNFGYKINDRWSIGGGPVYGHSTVELIQGVDLSSTPTSAGGPTFGQLGIPKYTEFARARLKGSANGFGFALGAYGKIAQNWTFGARFLSSIVFKYDNADATFTQTSTGIVLPVNNPINPGSPVPVDALLAPQFQAGGALVAQKVSTRIAHPAQAEVGFGYTGFQNWTLSADYIWIGWKQFTDLPVDFQGPASGSNRTLIEDYNNTSGIRLGAERSFGEGKLRFGYAGSAAAAPAETVTPLLPEQDRSIVTVGGAIPLFGRVSLDAAYSRVITPGRRGRVDERTSMSQTADQLNSGVYKLNANIFSASLKASF